MTKNDCFPALLTGLPEHDRVWFSVAFRSASGSRLKIASIMKSQLFFAKISKHLAGS
jgi:hypothetical protein